MKTLAKNPIAPLKNALESPAVRKSFEELLKQNAPHFISSIVSTVSGNKALLECDPMGIIRCASVAATLKLPILPDLGFAYIVPYKGVPTFQVGYKGFIQLALRSGQYDRMNAAIVQQNVIKSHNPITGEFEFDFSNPGKEIAGYIFYSRQKGGFEHYHYMTKQECFDHGKRYSQSFKKNMGVWVDNFDAMASKTVVKQALRKFGVLSIDFATQVAMTYDQGHLLSGVQEHEIGGVIFPDSPDTVTAESSAEALKEIQDAKAELVPGLTPPKTYDKLVDDLKDVPGGVSQINKIVDNLRKAGENEAASKLEAKIVSEGIRKMSSGIAIEIPESEKFEFEK